MVVPLELSGTVTIQLHQSGACSRAFQSLPGLLHRELTDGAGFTGSLRTPCQGCGLEGQECCEGELMSIVHFFSLSLVDFRQRATLGLTRGHREEAVSGAFEGGGARRSAPAAQDIFLDRGDAVRGTFPAAGMSALTQDAPTQIAEKRDGAVVRRLPVRFDDGALLRGLQQNEDWAKRALVERFASQSLRTIRKVLGPNWHVEPADVLHDAYIEALASVHTLRDPKALPKWMQTVCARAAYKAMRTRKRTSWLLILGPDEVPQTVVPGLEPELVEAHHRTHEILRAMPAQQRAAFAFRYISGMELTQVADACDVSLSTIKRCLAKAERRFLGAARKDAVLAEWLEEGNRWTR